MIKTKNQEKELLIIKRRKVLNLYSYHRNMFQAEQINNPKFIPRICYTCGKELVFGLYPREIYGNKDIYIEFCNKDYVPQDPIRTLWKWRFNPEYDKKYLRSDANSITGGKMYLIPITELVNVSKQYRQDLIEPLVSALMDITPKDIDAQKVPIKFTTTSELTISDEDTSSSDLSFSQATIRDIAAILWRKPVSHKHWINNLINNSFKNG